MKKLFYLSLVVLTISLPGCLSTTPSSGTIGINPDNVTVAAGTQQMFSAILTGRFANASVKWSVQGQGCSASSCGTIDQSGNYTAPTAPPTNPSIQVVATISTNTSQAGYANVTIAPPVSIAINPHTTQTLAAGQSQPFTATITNTSNLTANWTVSGTGCTGAACGTITPSTVGAAPATYTAPLLLPTPPTVTIKATSAADNTKSDTVNVNLILLVNVAPLTANVAVLHSQPFMATVVGSANQAVTWTLSGTGCAGATCGTIDAAGNYTAPIAVPTPPTVTVTATSQVDNTTQGTATVTVTGTSSGAPGQLLGRYAFFYRGYPTPTGTPRVEAGSLLFDGNGNVLAGSQIDQNSGAAHTQVAVTGTYTFDTGSTNRGVITLTAGFATSLKFALVPHAGALATKAYITDFGGSVAGGGRLEAQDPTALSTGALNAGGYAISLRGGTNTGLATTVASAVGRFDLSGGSVAHGELGRTFADASFGDCNATQTINASLSPAYSTFTGNYGALNTSTGLSTISLANVLFGNNTTGTTITSMSFAAYEVSANEIFLVETDTNGFTFVGSAELQSTNNFQNASFDGEYSLLMQINNGAAAGNAILTPFLTPAGAAIPVNGNVPNIMQGEYTGNLDGNLLLGLDIGEDFPGGGYYEMTQTNGLALTALCPGAFVPRLVMYFVSPQRGFVWNFDSNFSGTMLFPSDMIGEFDLQQGGPYGAQGQSSINGTYTFGFEGVQGNFAAGAHTVSNAIAESGLVTFTTTGTVDLTAQGEGMQQTGTITFTIDQANGTSVSSKVSVTGTFTFNDDVDGNDDGMDGESIGEIVFSAPPAFPVPDQFLVVNGNKILFLGLSTSYNISGVAVNQ